MYILPSSSWGLEQTFPYHKISTLYTKEQLDKQFDNASPSNPCKKKEKKRYHFDLFFNNLYQGGIDQFLPRFLILQK